MGKRQWGMGWVAVLIASGIVAGGIYYAYQGFLDSGEAPSCAAAQTACQQKCRRTATEDAAAQSCQQECQREANACAGR